MKQQSDEAFVLATRELGDADLIVSLMARDHGRVRCVAASARRSRKRFGGMLQPLTRLRARWTEREGRELHRLVDTELVRSFAAMQADPTRLAVCATMAEIAECYGAEGQPDRDGFRLLDAVLEALDTGGEPLALLRYFELWTLRLHGLSPDPGVCDECGATIAGDARLGPAGEPRCRACLGGAGRRLGADARSFLERARRARPSGIGAGGGAAAPRGALELLLRGALERFAERRFRGYRHVEAAVRSEAAARGTRERP